MICRLQDSQSGKSHKEHLACWMQPLEGEVNWTEQVRVIEGAMIGKDARDRKHTAAAAASVYRSAHAPLQPTFVCYLWRYYCFKISFFWFILKVRCFCLIAVLKFSILVPSCKALCNPVLKSAIQITFIIIYYIIIVVPKPKHKNK